MNKQSPFPFEHHDHDYDIHSGVIRNVVSYDVGDCGRTIISASSPTVCSDPTIETTTITSQSHHYYDDDEVRTSPARTVRRTPQPPKPLAIAVHASRPLQDLDGRPVVITRRNNNAHNATKHYYNQLSPASTARSAASGKSNSSMSTPYLPDLEHSI